jgi:hypothetical protein
MEGGRNERLHPNCRRVIVTAFVALRLFRFIKHEQPEITPLIADRAELDAFGMPTLNSLPEAHPNCT